jgi:carbamoyl-phosphate synthase large subunit
MAVTAIKALRKHSDVRIVATDIDELSPGLHMADTGYIVPPFDNDEYMNAILEIVEREDIDVVVPALDPILKRFAADRADFADYDAAVLVSPPETLDITQDKWKTYQHLTEILPLPQSWNNVDDVDGDGEYFVKPRGGSGSEDIHRVTSRTELEFYCERVSNPIIQDYLPGNEYTIDSLTDRNGALLACVPRLRKEITSGISTKVEVVENEQLVNLAQCVAGELTFTGPFFVQAKVDKNGVLRVIEIGARIAGTMCQEFVNPSLQYLSILQLTGKQVPEPTVNFGSQVSRYWDEQYFNEGEQFNELTRW